MVDTKENPSNFNYKRDNLGDIVETSATLSATSMTAMVSPKPTEPRALARAMPRFSVAPNRFEIAQAQACGS